MCSMYYHICTIHIFSHPIYSTLSRVAGSRRRCRVYIGSQNDPCISLHVHYTNILTPYLQHAVAQRGRSPSVSSVYRKSECPMYFITCSPYKCSHNLFTAHRRAKGEVVVGVVYIGSQNVPCISL